MGYIFGRAYIRGENLIYVGRIKGILRYVNTLKSITYVIIYVFKSNRIFGTKRYSKSIGNDQ